MLRTLTLSVSLFGGLAASACSPAADAGRHVDVIAHRGASWDAPEHTVAAWDLARAQGADWLEFDVQRTRDGVLVVFHDDSLDRVARGPVEDCSGFLDSKTWEQLQRCDVGRWFNEAHPDRAKPEYLGLRIPALDDVLARYGRDARLYLELKDAERLPDIAHDLYLSLVRHGLAGAGADTGRVLVQSFVPEALTRFGAWSPETPLIQLVWDSIPGERLDTALAQVAGYARGIGPAARITDQRLVEAAHAKGLLVHPYTVNEEAEMRRVLRLGVDGIFTDRPALLRSLF